MQRIARRTPARAAAGTKIFARTKKRRKKKSKEEGTAPITQKKHTQAFGGGRGAHCIARRTPVRAAANTKISARTKKRRQKKRIRTKEPRHYRKSRTRKLSAVGRGTQRIARNTPARAAARTKIFVRTKKRRDKKGPRHYRKSHTRKLSGA